MALLFNLREHDRYPTANPDFTFSKPTGTIVRMTSTNPSAGMGYIFVVVPRLWLHGKWIRFNWQGSSSIASAGIFGIRIYDGSYDRSSDVDFPFNAPLLLKGAGILQNYTKGATFGPITEEIQANVAGGTEDYCTIFFFLSDGWAAHNMWLQLDWFEINTGAGGAGNLYDEQFTDGITMERTASFGDYGYISDGDIPLPSLTIHNWRWYADDGAEPSVPLAGENVKPINIAPLTKIRLRICIHENDGINYSNLDLDIEYSDDLEHWFSIGSQVATDEDFRYADGQATHGNVLAGGKLTCQNELGKYHEQASVNIENIGANKHHEIDVAIMNYKALWNKTFYFRLVIEGEALSPEAGSTYPQLQTVPQPNWFDEWIHRKHHSIYEEVGGVVDMLVRLKVFRSKVGVLLDDEVSLEGNCNADISDVRFTDDDGETELEHYTGYHGISSITNATNCVGCIPVAIHYEGTYNRTYLTYLDYSGKKAMIAYYDHDGDCWSDSVEVGTVTASDHHMAPAIAIDSSGYIHIFYGPHCDTDMWYQKSTNPEDISSWSARVDPVNETCTYPQPIILSNGHIILFYRHQIGGTHFQWKKVISTDGGDSWGSKTVIVDFGNGYAIYAFARLANSDRIGLAWSPHYYSDAKQHDIFYAYTTDEGTTWWNVDGSHSEAIISKAEGETWYRAFDAGVNTSNAYAIEHDSNNYPYIGYYFSDGTSYQRLAKWNGLSWNNYTIVSAPSTCDLIVESSSIIYAYVTLSFNIEEYRTVNGGTSWVNTKSITADGIMGNQYQHPMVVRNFNDEVKLTYIKGPAAESADHDHYYYDEDSNQSKLIEYDERRIFWVKINDNLSESITPIYIYYDKSGESAKYDLEIIQWREHDNFVVGDPVFTFSKPDGYIQMLTTNASIGMGYIFVVVPREWLNGKYIRCRSRGQGSYDGNNFYFQIYDGKYDCYSDTDFPTDANMLLKGNGLLQTIFARNRYAWTVDDTLINVAGGTEEYCTIMFILNDGWNAQNFYMDIDYVEINTDAGGVGNLWMETFDSGSIDFERVSSLGDYGYFGNWGDEHGMWGDEEETGEEPLLPKITVGIW